jgi:tol-pal system protein YbgF
MKRYTLTGLLGLILLFAAGEAAGQSKEQREKIDRMAVQLEELKTETMLLQRQVQSMQDTFNKTMGELNTLVVQMSDNIATIRRAQSSISTGTSDTVTTVSAMGERLTATNQRMERLSEQFAQLKKVIEDIPKMPTFAQITPGNAEQLFAAAYSDYSRGNYDLALSEFRQYVEIYPGSELADNAQFWIGEIRLVQKNIPEAITEYDKVAQLNPNGDKATIAMHKRAQLLLQSERKDEAVAQWLALIKAFPKSPEAIQATEQLQQVAPEALLPPVPEKPAPRKGRRP